MPRIHLKRLLPGLKTLDMFGHPPELTFKGQPTYITYPGMVVSVIIYGLIIINTIQLAIAFNDGSKQNEKFNQEMVELNDIGPQHFSENHFEIAISTDIPITEEMGKSVAYQLLPCRKEGADCGFYERFSEPVPFQKCTEEKEYGIKEYMLKNFHKQNNERYGSNILCLDMRSFYLSGKPLKLSEGSLLINFQRNPDMITDANHPDFNSKLYKSFESAQPYLLVTLNQVDMKTGALSKVIRDIRATEFKSIELSMNTFLNKNNYLGLIH